MTCDGNDDNGDNMVMVYGSNVSNDSNLNGSDV